MAGLLGLPTVLYAMKALRNVMPDCRTKSPKLKILYSDMLFLSLSLVLLSLVVDISLYKGWHTPCYISLSLASV